MNTKSSEETDFPLKLEGNISSDHDKANKASSSSSSAQWLRLKDPRIVRVSRAFGGKDRHSKVCTVRGLRDRRVRLSVSTAIQLYDLQDRLGFNQPSKVVDWLLNAAKDEIDDLPPLQMPPSGSFSLCPPSAITSRNNEVSPSQPDGEGLNINESGHNWEGSSKSKVSREMMVTEKENWNRREEDDRDNLLSRANHPSFLGLLNTMPLGYNNQWEPSGGDVTHSGSHGFTNQADLHSINVVPFPASSTLSLSTGTSQFLACPPPAGATQSYFPGSHSIAAMDMDPRQINQYQMLGSSSSSQNFLSNSLGPSLYSMSQSVKPFSLSMMTPKLLHSPNSSESQSHKDRVFPSK